MKRQHKLIWLRETSKLWHLKALRKCSERTIFLNLGKSLIANIKRQNLSEHKILFDKLGTYYF